MYQGHQMKGKKVKKVKKERKVKKTKKVKKERKARKEKCGKTKGKEGNDQQQHQQQQWLHNTSHIPLTLNAEFLPSLQICGSRVRISKTARDFNSINFALAFQE